MRVATVDIGTNTVLLLVADRKQDGSLEAVTERATITRLGAGVDRSRRFDPQAVERTCDCLRSYGEIAAQLRVERTAVVGTSAMRDAAGGEVVQQCVRAAFGVDARVLSGPEEARLTFAGAKSGLAFDTGRDLAVFDIGGGSTEVVVPKLAFAQSFDVGSVRLTERHVRHDPPTSDEVEALGGAARDVFHAVPRLDSSVAVLGVAGTMTTLAAVSLQVVPYDGERVHGQRLSIETLRAVVNRLASLTVDERRVVPGMHPKRADVIVAGGVIALALLERLQAESVVISDRGVRWGLAEELVLDEPGT
jgi:exopolyphosphatase/guanosine-5'-triphosphate,3'-diphosphate pyrophosphatase